MKMAAFFLQRYTKIVYWYANGLIIDGPGANE